jgi:uncharacterized protein YndB with AHSA1/START domain
MNPIESPTYDLEVATPTERAIQMKRAFDAPRNAVFDALTEPRLIRRWLLGPDGWSMPVCEVDLNVGGAYRYLWRNDVDGKEFGVRGTYRGIVRADHIVHTERFDDEWYSGDALVTTTFAEHGDATMVTMTILYESAEARDTALASGMAGGVAKSYDRLAGVLSSI